MTRPAVPPDRQLLLAAKLREDRTAVRRLLETRAWIGGHRAPHRTVALTTADGIRLAASWLPGPVAAGPAVLLVHGLAASRRKPAYAFLADHLAGQANVLALDLRGHGQSGGACHLGAEEWQDLQAAVAALRARGQRRVVVVGLSLGAAAACHALARGLEVDGAVLISGSAHHGDLDLPGMRVLDELWRHPVKRRAWQAIAGFRMADPAAVTAYPDPVELLRGVTTPLLVVHGEDDAYFSMAHARALHAAPDGPAQLWAEPTGFGHAEDGLTPAFCARLSAAVAAVATTGRFPARDDLR